VASEFVLICKSFFGLVKLILIYLVYRKEMRRMDNGSQHWNFFEKCHQDS
jgi:hypothetical protein